MRLTPTSVLSVLAFLAPAGAVAVPIDCQPGTAADYAGLGTAGCLDRFGVLLSNFEFSTSGDISVPLSEVMVSPVVTLAPASRIPSGIRVDFSPAIVVPPSNNLSLTLGVTETFPGVVPSPAADFLVTYTNQFNTGKPDPFNRSFDFTITTDGVPIHFAEGPFAGVGMFVPIGPASTVSMLVTYRFSDPPTTQTTLRRLELATERVPEASTWLLTLSGLLAAGLIRRARATSSAARWRWYGHRRRLARLHARS